MKSIILVAAFAAGLNMQPQAQIYLQLERSGTLKTIRYGEGDVLTFRLKNDDKGWYERIILSLDVPHHRIIFPDVVIHLDSIEAIRLERKAVAAQIIGTALQAGGINMILFAGQHAVFQDTTLDWTTMAFGVVNIGVGSVVKKIFRNRIFRLSPRKRLRLLDMNF